MAFDQSVVLPLARIIDALHLRGYGSTKELTWKFIPEDVYKRLKYCIK